jgi:hypothetical protein
MTTSHQPAKLTNREKVLGAAIWGTFIVIGIGLLYWMSWASGD